MSDTAVRAELLAALRAAGVTTVRAEYDGEGDSGQMENPTLHVGELTPDSATVDVDLQALEDFFYGLLDDAYGGWENNDGAAGDFVWDILADKITHEHRERFTDYTTTTREL